MSKMRFALAAVAALAASAAFPMTLRVWNNTWRDAVEPETATVVPPYGFKDVTFTSGDQLTRVNSNVEMHNAVNQWARPAGLFICLPKESEEEPPAPAPIPAVGLMSVAAPAPAPAEAPAAAAAAGPVADVAEVAATPAAAPAPAEPVAEKAADPKPTPAPTGKAGGKK